MTIDRDILKAALKMQFDFHFSEMKRLLELTGRLSEEQFAAKNSSRGMQAIFAHILGADRFWWAVLTGSTATAEEAVDETSVDGLIAWTESEQAKWNEYIADLNDGKLVERFERDLPFGTFSFTIDQAMQHVILHGLQHHTEIAHMLTEAGYSPGDVDYFDYIAVRRGE